MHLPHQHGDDCDVLLLLHSTADDEVDHGEMTMQLQQCAALQGRRRCIGTRSMSWCGLLVLVEMIFGFWLFFCFFISRFLAFGDTDYHTISQIKSTGNFFAGIIFAGGPKMSHQQFFCR